MLLVASVAAVTKSAEAAAEDVVRRMSEELVGVGLACLPDPPCSSPAEGDLLEPPGALAARACTAAGLVLIEVGPPVDGAHDAARRVEDHGARVRRAARAGLGDRPRDQGDIEVLVGRRAAWSRPRGPRRSSARWRQLRITGRCRARTQRCPSTGLVLAGFLWPETWRTAKIQRFGSVGLPMRGRASPGAVRQDQTGSEAIGARR